MAANDTAVSQGTDSAPLGRDQAIGLANVVERLRLFVDFAGRWSSLLFWPLILFTVMDVVLRKTGRFQIDLIEFMGPFGRAFESTLLQEMEWHIHTALFAMVLGYGYIWNTQVRVDLVRETMAFRRKAWLEMLGCTFFMLPFTAVVIYFAAIFAYDSFMIGEISAPQVGLPYRFIIKSIMALGLFVAFLAGVAVWLQSIVILFGPKDLRFHLMTLEWPEEEGEKMEGKERLKVDLEKTIEDDLVEQTKKILGKEQI